MRGGVPVFSRPSGRFSGRSEPANRREASSPQRPALHAGKLNMVDAGNDSLLVYKRATSEETMLVVLNFSKNMQSYTLPVEDFNQWDLVFTGNEPITSHMTDATLDLPPYGLAILLSRAV